MKLGDSYVDGSGVAADSVAANSVAAKAAYHRALGL
jgi:hypothetical protein